MDERKTHPEQQHRGGPLPNSEEMTTPTILEAIEEHIDAIKMRDIDRFAATLAADDVRFVGGDGRIIGGARAPHGCLCA